MTATPPLLSVIVPVYDGAATLNATLAALTASSLSKESWELIVIDDASRDDSAIIAACYADRVMRLVGRPRGPAYARNRGFEIARGDIIAFIDADVHVNRQTLAEFIGCLSRDSSIAAVVGSYDTGPKAAGIVTRYRNVLHRYLRLRTAGDVDVFWPACGAIRRSDFVAAGMFDEWHYCQPQAEGVELGQRLRQLRRRIVLDPTIVATHVKDWSFRNVLVVDLFRIGVPWMRLLLQEGTFNSSRAPSLLASEKISTGLAATGLLCGFAFLCSDWIVWPSIAALCLTAILALNIGFWAFGVRRCGPMWLLGALPLHVLHYLVNAVAVGLAWTLHEIVGEPQRDPADDALAEVGLQMWPPVPQRRASDAWRGSA